MNITIRHEHKSDYRIVEELTREAFWNHYSPGCNEHYLVHIMRNSDAFVRELNFVAIFNNKIVRSIQYTRAFILNDANEKHPVLCFGPISVLPEFQRKGIGSRLIEHTKAIAKNLGYTAILIFGDPEVYKKLGFVQAETFFIGTSWDTYAVSLLACELMPDALEKCSGRFFEDTIYNIDESLADQFDASFLPKQRLTGSLSQVRFSELVAMSKPRV